MKVTVIIPTYNRFPLILRAIDSVLSEINDGDEIIVIDDGSTDGTETALVPYLGKIRYIRTSNRKAGAARNLGIDEAKNPVIAFLDSDDIWLPGKLRIQKDVLTAFPDMVFAFSNFKVRNLRGEEISGYIQYWRKDIRPWDSIMGKKILFSSIAPLVDKNKDFYIYLGDLYCYELERNCIGTFTLIFRRDKVSPRVRFAEDLPTYEDWEFFGRLCREGEGAYIDCDLAIQYGHEGPRLTNIAPLKSLEARLEIIQRVWGEDSEFLEGHRKFYEDVLNGVRRTRIKALLREGAIGEAKSEISKLSNSNLLYNFIGAMPSKAISLLLRGYVEIKRSV